MKVFLDLDGVLVDWSGGLCELMGIDPYCPEAQEILRSSKAIQGWKFGSVADIDNAVIAAGYDYWMNLELLPWAQQVLDICSKYDLYFLTSPGVFHAGAHAKLDYIWKHFGSRNYILTKQKYVCANPNHILIDDMEKNITEWTKNKGVSFHWPCQWKLREDPKLLESTLSALWYQLNRLEYY